MSEHIHSSAHFHGDLPSATSDQGLFDHKELSATALERTRMPIVVADARAQDLPIVLANKAFLQLTGYSADEVIGQNCRFLQGEGTSPAVVGRIRAGLLNQREVSVEILNYRKDGSAFWNKLYLSPIHDEDGQLIYWFASQVDNTRFRKVEALEETEHRLLKEVDHRSKNVLAIVDSIVRLSNTSDPQLYAASIQHRVQALSRVHGLFSEQGWKDISLEDVARLQLRPFAGDRATFEGPPVMLSPVTLQPLGLIFHELATNAASHGALAVGDGTVRVEWNCSEGMLIISWIETGIPAMADVRAKGFGTVMIDAMAERQLNGHVQREWTGDTLTVVLTLASRDRGE